MDGEVVLPPAHPPKSTSAAYNVYPFSDGGGGPRRHSRLSPFFGALNYRPELRNSSLERVAVYARTRGGWNTAAYDPGGLRGWEGGSGQNLRHRLFDVA